MPSKRSAVSLERSVKWEQTRRQVGARVRQLRLEAGLSQEALALEAELSRNQLIRLEQGAHGLLFERLVDLADVIGCDVKDFFDAKAPETAQKPRS